MIYWLSLAGLSVTYTAYFFEGTDHVWFVALVTYALQTALIANAFWIAVPYKKTQLKLFTLLIVLWSYAVTIKTAAVMFLGASDTIQLLISSLIATLFALWLVAKAQIPERPTKAPGQEGVYLAVEQIEDAWGCLFALFTRPYQGCAFIVHGDVYRFRGGKWKLDFENCGAAGFRDLPARAVYIPLDVTEITARTTLNAFIGRKWRPWFNCYTIAALTGLGPVEKRIEEFRE